MIARIPLRKQTSPSPLMDVKRTQESYHLTAQEGGVLRAVRPSGWRDAWKVLRGTYRPQIALYQPKPMTVGEVNTMLKDVWNGPELTKLHQDELSVGGISRRWRR